MRLDVAALSLLLRRTPFESLRWRLAPQTLERCRQSCREPTVRRVRTRHGFRMQIDVSDWLGRHIYVTGEYEPATTALLNRLVRPGDTFLDIGANAGYFTLLAAKLVGPTGAVHSFEPLPSLAQQLRANLDLNGFRQCTTHDVAASDKADTCTFYSGPRDHTGVSSLRALEGPSETMVVSTARVDDVLKGVSCVSFAKIDVEGAECHVLEGMQGILQRFHPGLVVEITPTHLAGMQRSVEQIEELLRPLGYRTFVIEHHGLREVGRLSEEKCGQFNAFFCTGSAEPVAATPPPVREETAPDASARV